MRINLRIYKVDHIWHNVSIGHVNNIPPVQFSLEFRETFSQNHICYHLLCVSGISKIMHCGILINMPLSWQCSTLYTIFRVHLNDFENIVPFFFLGLFFTMITGGRLSEFYAKCIWRTFFFSRIGMSICHYFEIQVCKTAGLGFSQDVVKCCMNTI